MEAIANSYGNHAYLPASSLPQALGILSRLADVGLVSLRTPRNVSMSFRASRAGGGGARPLVSLAIEEVTVLVALEETHLEHLELARKYLSRS
jgi:hypothetical protein